MHLRDHPLMNYRNIPNWPPHWLPRKDSGGQQLAGEIAALVEVVVVCNSAENRKLSQLFLFMEYCGEVQVAAVLFDDAAFCRQVGDMMKNFYGHSIEEIGGLNVSGLL